MKSEGLRDDHKLTPFGHPRLFSDLPVLFRLRLRHALPSAEQIATARCEPGELLSWLPEFGTENI